MQIRNLSSSTQRAYVDFARHFGQSLAVLGPEEIRAYQVYLTNDKQLAPASVVIAVAALRFLYKVTLQQAWSVEAVIPAPKTPPRRSAAWGLVCLRPRRHHDSTDQYRVSVSVTAANQHEPLADSVSPRPPAPLPRRSPIPIDDSIPIGEHPGNGVV